MNNLNRRDMSKKARWVICWVMINEYKECALDHTNVNNTVTNAHRHAIHGDFGICVCSYDYHYKLRVSYQHPHICVEIVDACLLRDRGVTHDVVRSQGKVV